MSQRCCATPRASPSRRAADARGQAPRRRRISPQRRAGPGHRRPLARRADHRLGADRHLAGRGLHRPEAPGRRRGDLPGRGLCARSARIRSHHQATGISPAGARQDHASTAASSMARQPSGLDARRRDQHRQGDRAAGLSRLRVRPRRRQRRRRSAQPFRSPTCPRPTAPAKRASPQRSTRCRPRRGRRQPRS